MRKTLGSLLLAICMLLMITPLVSAQGNTNSKRSIVVLEREEVVNEDYFAAGDTVTISGTVNGDAYVAGGEVIVDGNINGDLISAAGTLTVTGRVSQNIRAVGGSVHIKGEVGRNVTIGAGKLTISETARVNGSLVAGAGDVETYGEVARQMRIGAGKITLGNRVGGDVILGAGAVNLLSTTNIAGNLNYYSENKAQILNGAVVAGEVTHSQLPMRERRENSGKYYGAAKLGSTIISFLSAALIGLIVLKFFPKLFVRGADMIRSRSWVSLGLGFAILVLAPIAMVLLLITVIGIPVALMSLAVYLISIYCAGLVFAYLSGEWVRKLLKMNWGKYTTFIAGLLLFVVIRSIPVAGGIFAFVAMLVGLGALALTGKHFYDLYRRNYL